MNERDYLLMEAMAVTGGALVITTVVCMFILFNLPVDMSVVIIISFIAFVTFFLGLSCHLKRRIFVLEMEALSKEAKDEVDGHTTP